MKQMRKYISLLLVAALLGGCDKFDDINTDPDATNKVTSSLLATGLLLNITTSSSSKSFIYDELLNKQLAWGDAMEDYQYNVFGRSSFGGYSTLINAQKMVESVSDNNVNAYQGLAHFIKAYKLFYLSMEMGDIPYEEALKGEEGLVKPKYNTQKEVMTFVLNDLEKAYDYFSTAKNFSGDPILGGDVQKWKKTTTAFQLKVLLALSKKADDTDLNIKKRFAQIVASADLMTSNSDNFQMAYSDKAQTIYPFHTTNTKQAIYAMLSTMLVDKFKATNDIRLFYYGQPAKSKLNEGVSADSWDAYIGVDPSLPPSQMEQAYVNGAFSSLNLRYTNYPAGEPVVYIGYAEQNFILAEAATRKWISGDATLYYQKGIEAHLKFIAANTPNEAIYHHGHPITDPAIAHFLQLPTIQLTGETESDIEKIITQRYLASFMQHPYDTYYDYRRTGYPVLPINPETNRNAVKNQLPMRWLYPKSELDYNKEHIEEALQRQFGGIDDVNKRMWILQ